MQAGHARGVRPKVAMVFFDERNRGRICEELGYDLILPAAEFA